MKIYKKQRKLERSMDGNKVILIDYETKNRWCL